MSERKMADEDFLRDVQAFVAEKWQQHHPCDRCGTFQWSILPGNATVLSARASTPRSMRQGFRSVSVQDVEFIPIYCNNCGNTVHIYTEVFDEWRKNRRTT
jgi:hypothetical protein